jgi:hypothetical protein
MERLGISVRAVRFNFTDGRAQAHDWCIGTVRTNGAEGFHLVWRPSDPIALLRGPVQAYVRF